MRKDMANLSIRDYPGLKLNWEIGLKLLIQLGVLAIHKIITLLPQSIEGSIPLDPKKWLQFLLLQTGQQWSPEKIKDLLLQQVLCKGWDDLLNGKLEKMVIPFEKLEKLLFDKVFNSNPITQGDIITQNSNLKMVGLNKHN